MKLFAIEYHGSYCHLVQIVRAESLEVAKAMADKLVAANEYPYYHSYSVEPLEVSGDAGVIFQTSYIQ